MDTNGQTLFASFRPLAERFAQIFADRISAALPVPSGQGPNGVAVSAMA